MAAAYAASSPSKSSSKSRSYCVTTTQNRTPRKPKPSFSATTSTSSPAPAPAPSSPPASAGECPRKKSRTFTSRRAGRCLRASPGATQQETLLALRSEAHLRFPPAHVHGKERQIATLASPRLRDGEKNNLLMVVVRNHTTGSAWPLTNNPDAIYNDPTLPDGNRRFLWQLVRASTAAPVFFLLRRCASVTRRAFLSMAPSLPIPIRHPLPRHCDPPR